MNGFFRKPNGTLIVRTTLSFQPGRDDALITILEDAERTGASVAAVIREMMRTGVTTKTLVEVETDETELLDLSDLAFFDD